MIINLQIIKKLTMKNLFKLFSAGMVLIGSLAFGQTREIALGDLVKSDYYKMVASKVGGTIKEDTHRTFEMKVGDNNGKFMTFEVVTGGRKVGFVSFAQDDNGKYHAGYGSSSKLDASGTGETTIMNFDSGESFTAVLENNDLIEIVPKNSEFDNTYESTARRNPLDLNGDGNVGFFECYRAVKQHMASNDLSTWIEDIPGAGTLIWASASAACGYYSAIY